MKDDERGREGGKMRKDGGRKRKKKEQKERWEEKEGSEKMQAGKNGSEEIRC